MTTITAPEPRRAGLLKGWEPAMALTGLAMLALMLPTAWAALGETRTLNGVNVWDKALKFELSTGLFLLTAAWVNTRLPTTWRHTVGGRYVIWTAIAATVFEVGYIVLQASKGEASHFNATSALAMTMYALMGVGALALVSTSLVQGIAVLRSPGVGDPPAFRLALGWGLVLTFVLGAITGGYMGAQTSHWVGGVASDVGGLPLLGWSTTGGDLRAPHFLGVHASQILPVVALVLIAANPRRANALTVLAIMGYVALTAAVFVQALSGQPLIAL